MNDGPAWPWLEWLRKRELLREAGRGLTFAQVVTDARAAAERARQ